MKALLEVRQSTNASSKEDIVDSAILCIKAGNFESLKSEFINSRINDRSKSAFKVVEEILKVTQNNISFNEEKITSIDFSKDKDQKGVLLAADFLQESGAIDKTIHILNKYFENHSCTYSIINQLYDMYNRLGDSSQSHKVLNESIESSCDDQKSFEIFIDNLINEGFTKKAEQLLRRERQ